MEIHELLRDFPELLSVFAERGIGGRERGNETVDASLFSGDGEGEDISSFLRWRTPDGA
jgi:hypothetical protein